MKKKVTNIETGEVKNVDAVDAREMVKSGGWATGHFTVKKKAPAKKVLKT